MEEFIKFLADNNAWENFERNFIKQGGDVKRFKRDCKVWKNLELSMAFTWDDTNEGHKYWRRLNDLWGERNEALKEQLLREGNGTLIEQLLSDD